MRPQEAADRPTACGLIGWRSTAWGWNWFGTSAQGEIAADADRLIVRFADRAYFEARDRGAGRCIDGNRSRRYWTSVKLEIAKRQGVAIGLSGAEAWA